MLPILNQMLASLQQDLAMVTKGQEELSFQLAELAFRYVVMHLLRLKEHLKSITWSDQATTLHFFKKIQPAYFTEILFYYKVLQTEEQKPSGSANHIKLYYKSLIPAARQYLQRQHFLQTYDSLGLTYLDDSLFGLPPEDISVYPADNSFHYTEYFNFFSYCLSKIRAMERLEGYLYQRYLWATATENSAGTPFRFPTNPGISKNEIQSEAREIKHKISWLESEGTMKDKAFDLAISDIIKRRQFYGNLLSSFIERMSGK